MLEKTVSDLVLDEIEKLGTEVIFLVPGANIFPFVKCLKERKNIKIIIANHELAAGFMAIGYARTSGKPGVVCTISGPGLAYATGAGITAKADNVPLLFISGNIPEKQWGKGYFQDGSPLGSNDTAIFYATTGISLTCHKTEQIITLISKIRNYLSEFKPVHIQLPLDIQESHCDGIVYQSSENYSNFNSPDIKIDIAQHRIVLLIGQKALNLLCTDSIRSFVKRFGIGVITDLKSRGIIDESSVESLGYIGFNSDRKAIEALDFESPHTAYHVYIIGVEESLQERYVSLEMKTTKIEADAFQRWLDNGVIQNSASDIEDNNDWLTGLQKIVTFRDKIVQYSEKISYSDVFSSCMQSLPKGSVYCLDAGQVRRAGNMMLKASSLNSIIQSDTLSPMGAGISAAIGAKLAIPERTVIALFGDGSMRMHGMELATAKRYKLPIIFLLCDNESYASTPGNNDLKKLPAIQWDLFAQSLGIKTFKVNCKNTLTLHLKKALTLSEPILLWAKVPNLLDEEIDIIPVKTDSSWLSEYQK